MRVLVGPFFVDKYPPGDTTMILFDGTSPPPFNQRMFGELQNLASQFYDHIIEIRFDIGIDDTPFPRTHSFFDWVRSLKFISMHVQTCDHLKLDFWERLDLRYVDMRFSDALMLYRGPCDAIIHVTTYFRICNGGRSYHTPKSLIV